MGPWAAGGKRERERGPWAAGGPLHAHLQGLRLRAGAALDAREGLARRQRFE